MKALLVGNGAREHAIAAKIAQSAELCSFISARNPGIVRLSKEVQVGNTKDPAAVLAFAEKTSPDYVIIGPDASLGAGVADPLVEKGFAVVGPTKELARIETDKGFARQFMRENIRRAYPRFKRCETPEQARDFIRKLDGAVVVKALGLTGGKGVRVMGQQLATVDDAEKYAAELIAADGACVIEQKLEGEEFSLQNFVDGRDFIPMPLVQDHKHAFDNDTGPMTGGMGSYSDENHLLPFMDERDYRQALGIVEKTVKHLPGFKGILYSQFMLCADGPYVIEYNARFADPESINVLSVLESDFNEICTALTSEKLASVRAEFEPKATVVKYVVPEGYPDRPKANEKIQLTAGDAGLFYASVDQKSDGLYTSSSRAIACLGIAHSIEDAERLAMRRVLSIRGPVFFRKDIGTRELVQKRVEHMRQLRPKAAKQEPKAEHAREETVAQPEAVPADALPAEA
jgi:phosphoribosylamine--glycine ligase